MKLTKGNFCQVQIQVLSEIFGKLTQTIMMEIQVSKSNVSKEGECLTVFKRRAPNGKIKITIQEGRLQAFLKVKGASYTPVALQGLPLHWRQMDVGRVRQFLEKSYVKGHKGCIEVIQRGLGGGNNASTPVTITAQQITKMDALLKQVSDERQRDEIRLRVLWFLNHPEENRLRLENSAITLEGMRAWIAILENNPLFRTLGMLDLHMNEIDDSGVKVLVGALEKNQTLQQLVLSYNLIDDSGAQALAGVLEKNQTLQRLILDSNLIGAAGAQALAEALKKNQTLQQLVLGCNRIGAAGAQALAEVLKKNQTLQQLDLSYNLIGEFGAQALAEALKKNKTLQQLVLNRNEIGDSGVKVLAEVLKKNQTLQQLDLSYNLIGEFGAQALAEALKKNKTLQQLVLNRNEIGDSGVKVLAEVLKKHPTLQQLDLFSNQIGAAGAQALAEVLEKNQTLQQLVFRVNPIGVAGVQALAVALKKNRSLQQLDLWNTQIGDSGVQALAEALKQNQTLQELILNRNEIGNSGVQALAEALKQNQTLQELDLLYNQIDDAGAQDQVRTLLEKNQRIAFIFHKQTEDLQTFIQSHQNQLIREEEHFLSFQKEIERQHEKLETLRASLEKILRVSGGMSLNEGYRKILEDMEKNLHDLLLMAFEDKLALLSQGYFSEKSSEERKLTLGCSLYEIWTSFFGFQCPDWLKGKGKSLTTFSLLLSIAEEKEEESFDPPEILFQRMCQLNQSKL